MTNEPLVYLVGAGPGHPGLLTLRAVECLARAELVVYDKLVPPALLDHAPPTAERLCVTELPGPHGQRYDHIHRVLIEAGRRGRRVVRLKGGDPFLFGRGGEEAEALREAGIPYEVVPGVTAALAAAAFAGLPLTHRLHSSAVALVTGHECPGKSDTMLDWPALARFPGTLVFYMGLERLPVIAAALVEHGRTADTPAAAVQWASTGRQRAVEATLDTLPAAVRDAGLVSPTLVIVGTVVQLRRRLAWAEQRPLAGRRVVVTRPRHQAGDLVGRLTELGAVPLVLPTVEVGEPADWAPVDAAIRGLAEYHWLVFTSANGVHAFLRRLRQQGRDLRALGRVQLAVIGPATADALRAYHLEPDLVPAEYRSECLADALKGPAAGRRVLLARADRGRDVLREQLAAVAEVEQVAVYSQADAVAWDEEVLQSLRAGEVDFVTLTSSNIARALFHALDEPAQQAIRSGRTRLVSISPVTSAEVRALGWPVAAEATEYTAAGVVEALVGLARR